MIGIGEFASSNNRDDVLKTLALGSCVGVVILDPKVKAIGMLHVVLPESSINLQKSRQQPGFFPDTGIPALLEEMKQYGTDPNSKNLRIKIAGGAEILDAENRFNIGKRNVLAVRKILWNMKLGILSEDVEGHISRTLIAEVGTGKVKVSNKGKTREI
jgi:chemotaxis protein CheD